MEQLLFLFFCYEMKCPYILKINLPHFFLVHTVHLLQLYVALFLKLFKIFSKYIYCSFVEYFRSPILKDNRFFELLAYSDTTRSNVLSEYFSIELHDYFDVCIDLYLFICETNFDIGPLRPSFAWIYFRPFRHFFFSLA